MKVLGRILLVLWCVGLVSVYTRKIAKRRLFEDEGPPQVEQSASEEEEDNKQEDEEDSYSGEEESKEETAESSEEPEESYEEVLDEEIPLVHQEKAEPNVSSLGDVEDPQVAKINKIKDKLLEYEQEYKECLSELKDNEFNDEQIEECMGQHFLKFILDVKYETMIAISKEDSAVRRIFIDLCYAEAGRDLPFATGCDLMEQDVLELLWNGLDFNEIIALNREKYTKDLGIMPKVVYADIMDQLAPLNDNFFGLLDQIDAFKENLVMRLKIFIDERYKSIYEAGLEIRPSSIIHEVKVSQSQKTVDPENEAPEGEARKLKTKPKPKKSLDKVKRKLNRVAFVPGKPSLFKALPSLSKLNIMKSRNVHTRYDKPSFGKSKIH